MQKDRLNDIKRKIEIRRKLRESKEAREKEQATKTPTRTVPLRQGAPVRESTRTVRRPMVERQARVASPIRPNVNKPLSLNEQVDRKIKAMPANQQHVYKVLAENMMNYHKELNEATQTPAVAVGKVMTYFDIFFGFYPELITLHYTSEQPIKTAVGIVQYFEAVAGNAKGETAQNALLSSPFELGSHEKYTAANSVKIASLGKTDTTYSSATTLWGPFVPKSVKIAGADLTWSSNTAFTGTLNSKSITDGAVSVAGGTITVAFKVETGGAGVAADVFYSYDNAYAPINVPELEANVKQVEIHAKYRTIKTNFSVASAMGFEAQFGKKLGDHLAEAAMYELRRAIDLESLSMVFAIAPKRITWNSNPSNSAGLRKIHKDSFFDAVATAGNLILQNSKRYEGNVLVVGTTAKTVVETLPQFTPKSGAGREIGKLGTYKVVASPDLEADDWFVAFKDESNNLNAGIIFAPYIPVMATPETTLDDFLTRRAYMTAYGLKAINPSYFVWGKVANDSTSSNVITVADNQ